MPVIPRAYLYAAAAVVAVVLIVWAVQSIRGNAVWREQARVADSTAKVEQRNRVRIEASAAIAQARADSFAMAVTVLTRRADAAAARATLAQNDTRTARRDRDKAIAALTFAATSTDSLTALVAKSGADDSVIAGQARVIVAKTEEAAVLRSALDSAGVATAQLAVALDSARAQLQRDGKVIQQLQGVVNSARGPKQPVRLQPYAEALVDPADTHTTIARAGLQVNLTGHLAFVAAGERAFMPNHSQSRWLVGGRWNFR